jgi:DNA primase
MFPPEEDPDSYVRNHRTADIKEFFSKEKDFIRFKTSLLLEDAQGDPVKKATLIREIVETISLIPDSIYRNVYIKECSSLLDTPEQVLVNELNKIFRKKFRKDEQAQEQTYIPDSKEATLPPVADADYTDSKFQEREIIRLLLQYGVDEITITKENEIAPGMSHTQEINVTVGKYLVNAIKADDLAFNDAVYQMIFDEYHKLLKEGESPDEKDFINHELEQVRATAADLLSSPYSLSENWEKNRIYVSTESNKLKMLVDSSLLSFKIKKIEFQINGLQEKIKAESEDSDIEFLLKEMKDLKNISRRFNQDLSRIITH